MLGKCQFFDKNNRLTPLEKMQVLGLSEVRDSIGLKRFISFLELHQTLFLDAFCIKTKHGKIGIFDKNLGLTPSEKCKFGVFFKSGF